MSDSSSKMALFIDGPHLYAAAKTLGIDVDYKRLVHEFQSRGKLVRAFYYTAIIEDGSDVTAVGVTVFFSSPGRVRYCGGEPIHQVRSLSAERALGHLAEVRR